MMKQSDAVVQAVINVTGHEAYSEVACELTSEQRSQVRMILFEGFKSKSIVLSPEKYAEGEKSINDYIPGLINNHMRKDKRLNGNVTYAAKNPGSRAGSGDAQLKNLKALLGTVATDADRAEIQSYIDARTAELNAAKQATTVDFSALPADLQAKFKR